MKKKTVHSRITRLIAVLICIAVILPLCAGLSGCHTHERQWQSDTLQHRYICSCGDYILEGEHVYDEGKVSREATQEKDGERIYTCGECLHEKTEVIRFEGLSEQQWNATMSHSAFKNCSYRETASIISYLGTVETVSVFLFTEQLGFARITIDNKAESEYVEGVQLSLALDSLVLSIREIADYESYEYDRETKTYKSRKPIYIKTLDTSVNTTIKFTDGRISEISYTGSVWSNGTTITVMETIEIYDYGTTYVSRT